MIVPLEKISEYLYSFPDSLGDDLIVEFQESKGKHFGRVLVQVATIADDPVILYVPYFFWTLLVPIMSDDHHDRIHVQLKQADKLRWWPIYREPDHELVGKLQLYVNYSTSADDNSHLKVS